DPRETGINFLGYTQISAMTSFDHYFNDMIGIDARVGYDIQDINSIAKDSAWFNPTLNKTYAPTENQEREFHSRTLLKIKHDLFSIAIGPAITYETYGLSTFNNDSTWRVSGDLNSTKQEVEGKEEYGESWSTTMFSSIGELQIHPRKDVNLLFGLRSDKHDYTPYMHSPRASVVWAANDWSLYRVNYSRSNRRNDETDLRVEYLETKKDQGVVETIDYIEISPEFKPIKNLTVKPTIYGALYNPVGWVWTRGEETLGKTMDLGNVKYAGVELSAEYRNRNHHIRGSHSYIRILESNLLKRENNIFITAMEYGYGNSFIDFPDHISKLYYSYSINSKFNVQSSLQAYWKFQGAIDASQYNSDSLNSNQAYTMESKSEKAFGPTVNLNLGGSYKLPYNFTMRLNMYNLLNLIDEDLSKRNEFQRMSMYRIEPFSLSLNVTYSL
ncbi:MAG: TonB-dependent receptor, partial [Fibrobacterales bacterium]